MTKAGLIQTHTDTPLSEAPTKEEYDCFHQRLSIGLIGVKGHCTVNKVCSSMMTRAQETAKGLGFNQGIHTTPYLNEVNLKHLDNRDKHEVWQERWHFDWWDNAHNTGIETKAQVIKRIEKFIKTVDPKQQTIIFAHGIIIKMFVNRCFDYRMPFLDMVHNFRIAPLGIAILHVGDDVQRTTKFRGLYNPTEDI
jgi:broad specificity phosphatase PhoE